jgi:hypothetical protein
LLLAAHVITADMLREALAYQKEHGGKIVHALNALGHLSIEDFVNFVGSQPGIASIDLAHYKVPPEAVKLLSREFLEKHEVFPIDKLGKGGAARKAGTRVDALKARVNCRHARRKWV